LTNKEIYWIFINEKKIPPKITQCNWNKFNLTQDEWKEIFCVPAIIRDTKIRTFQYKLLFNLLPCNLYLNRIKRSDTNTCDQCQLLDDTPHYMAGCERVKPFWNSFTRWWNQMTNEKLILSNKIILTGMLGKKEKNKLLNACLLLAKWNIYKTKLNLSNVSFYKYLCDLKYFLVIEKTIAIRNNKLEAYENTWSKIEQELT
jgi:hypothetical protein